MHDVAGGWGACFQNRASSKAPVLCGGGGPRKGGRPSQPGNVHDAPADSAAGCPRLAGVLDQLCLPSRGCQQVGRPCFAYWLARLRAAVLTCPAESAGFLADLWHARVDLLRLWKTASQLRLVPRIDPDAMGSVQELPMLQGAVWAGPDRVSEGDHMVPAAAGEAEPGREQAAAQGQGQRRHTRAGVRAGASFPAMSVMDIRNISVSIYCFPARQVALVPSGAAHPLERRSCAEASPVCAALSAVFLIKAASQSTLECFEGRHR